MQHKRRSVVPQACRQIEISTAGLVWIFQFQFDSVKFSISSTLFRFFDFGIRTPLQYKTILVCEH